MFSGSGSSSVILSSNFSRCHGCSDSDSGSSSCGIGDSSSAPFALGGPVATLSFTLTSILRLSGVSVCRFVVFLIGVWGGGESGHSDSSRDCDLLRVLFELGAGDLEREFVRAREFEGTRVEASARLQDEHFCRSRRDLATS